jgi:Arc/MetJ-type ribon-helix-helix transcriptional regulator
MDIILRKHDKMEALSVDTERKVRGLGDAGYYSNKSEVIKKVSQNRFAERNVKGLRLKA